MPAEIGPHQHGTLTCEVDTGAGGNVMPLQAFASCSPDVSMLMAHQED